MKKIFGIFLIICAVLILWLYILTDSIFKSKNLSHTLFIASMPILTVLSNTLIKKIEIDLN